MNRNQLHARAVLQEIGTLRWTQFDAFELKTKLGAKLLLSPNGKEGLLRNLHIDEIQVPEHLQRKGIATNAMTELCRLADKYQFKLYGGPIGWSDAPWRGKFVEWLLRFGFERDPNEYLAQIDDPKAFYIRRLPRSV